MLTSSNCGSYTLGMLSTVAHFVRGLKSNRNDLSFVGLYIQLFWLKLLRACFCGENTLRLQGHNRPRT